MEYSPRERLNRARSTPPEYEDRCVALIDVLGWGSVVKRSVSDRSVLEAVSVAAEVVAMVREWVAETRQLMQDVHPEIELDVRVTHFSDTFIISTPAPRGLEPVSNVVIPTIYRSLLDEGLYSRGAIVRGQLVHNPNVVFGPALIEAHEIEKHVAKYPRIVIDPSARALVHEYDIQTDLDGMTFLHVLSMDLTESRISGWRARAEARLREDTGNLAHQAKHHWFLRYLTESERSARERGRVAADA
jgi:hypothetical protein